MIRNRDIDVVNRTIQIADNYKEVGVYTMIATLAIGKRIISTGINDYDKTHPNTPQIYDTHVIPTHAEVDCISKWIVKNRRIESNMTLYVVGYTKSLDNTFVISSFPCPSCMMFIKRVGISRVVYMSNVLNSVSIEEYLL